MIEDNFDNKKEKLTDTDYNIDFIGYSMNTLNYALYTKLNQFEHHFDTITTKYKYIDLTWLLATFAGIGFFLSKQSTGLPFDHLLTVTILALIGFFANILLWHLDVNTYSKFWAAVFIEEIALEKKFNFLLKSKSLNLSIDDDRQRIFSHGLLYLVTNCFLLITMGSFLAFYVYENSNILIAMLFFIGSFIFAILTTWYMNYKNNQTKKVFNEILKNKIKGIK